MEKIPSGNEIVEAVAIGQALLKEAQPYLPMIRVLIAEYANELYPLIESLAFTSVDLRAKMISRLEDKHLFTRDEAIAIANSIVVDTATAMHNAKP